MPVDIGEPVPFEFLYVYTFGVLLQPETRMYTKTRHCGQMFHVSFCQNHTHGTETEASTASADLGLGPE